MIMWRVILNMDHSGRSQMTAWKCTYDSSVNALRKDKPPRSGTPLLARLQHAAAARACKFSRIRFKEIKVRVRVSLRQLWEGLSSKSWIICFELLHCYQKGLWRRVWGEIWSVCPKTLIGILRPRGTMGKEWRLTGKGSWGWVWLTAISYVWNCVYFCLAAARGERWLSGTSLGMQHFS